MYPARCGRFSQVGSAYVVVVDIDRLGRDAPEVMTRIRDPGVRGIVLRSRREGIDTSNATGRREGTGQTKAVASKTQLVSAVAKFSKCCGWREAGEAGHVPIVLP